MSHATRSTREHMVVITPTELGLARTWSDAELGLVGRRAPSGPDGDAAAAGEPGGWGERRYRSAASIESWEQHTAKFRTRIKRRTYASAKDEFADIRPGGSPKHDPADDNAMMRRRLEREESDREAAMTAVSRSDSNRSRIHAVFSGSMLGDSDGEAAVAQSFGSDERRRRIKSVIRQLSVKIHAAEDEGRHADGCGLRLHRAIARTHCGQHTAAQVDVNHVLRNQPLNSTALSLRSKLVRHTSSRREQVHRHDRKAALAMGATVDPPTLALLSY